MFFSIIFGFMFGVLQLTINITYASPDPPVCDEALPPAKSMLLVLKSLKQDQYYFDYSDPLAYQFTTTPEILAYFGYSFTVYNVTGWDGYILTVYRIKKGKYNNNFALREPVIIHHGVAGSSADFFSFSVDVDNLPLYLVEHGYDVWLVNARGTSYSRNHVSLKEDQLEYWDFRVVYGTGYSPIPWMKPKVLHLHSWDEMGHYDLPALIDTVLHTTGFSQLSYIGYSMGAAVFFTGMHYNPHHAAKVRKLVAMSPAVYIGNQTSLFVTLLRQIPEAIFEDAFNHQTKGKLGQDELYALLRKLAPILCSNKMWDTNFCIPLDFIIGGFAFNSELESETVIRAFAHAPDSASARCLTHFGQNSRSGKFETQARYVSTYHATVDQLYDRMAKVLREGDGQAPSFFDMLLDTSEELPTPIMYKEPKPYNFHRINMPTLFMVGRQDSLVVPCDAYKTYEAIGSTEKEFIIVEDANHFDVIWGKNAKAKFYEPVLDFLQDGTPTTFIHPYDRKLLLRG